MTNCYDIKCFLMIKVKAEVSKNNRGANYRRRFFLQVFVDELTRSCSAFLVLSFWQGWFPALHHFRFLQQNLLVFISFLHFKSLTSSNAERPLDWTEGRGSKVKGSRRKPRFGFFWLYLAN